jgi:malonyl-CoA O-methyltransferase
MQLDKAKIRQSFSAASASYDGVAALQRNVGEALLNSIDRGNLNGTLLDLGCGTGFLTSGLLRHASPVIALDIALPMVQVTRAKLAGTANAGYVCADAEQLPLAAGSVDGVFSNLALQWCLNLDGVFTDIKRILKPGGRLVFSTFGPQTLKELKAAWTHADGYNHVNEFYSETQLTGFLRQAGFGNIAVENKTYISNYDSVVALMKELKHIGAHNVMSDRNKGLTTRTAMHTMMTAYERHRTDGRIPATFEVITVTAS